jgi:DNA (cytosine-5)-methyltransferase 1
MTRPLRVLDLFCCEGGASEGYRRAGFLPYGVDSDTRALRRYPFPKHHGDALAVMRTLLTGGAVDFTHPDGTVEWLTLTDFVVLAGSPPCQPYSRTRTMPGAGGAAKFPALVPDVRELFTATGLPYVIENVPGAPMVNPVMLCGRAYGLASARHRLFESNVWLMSAGCACGRDSGIPICGHGVPSSYRRRTGRSPDLPERRAAIGAPEWMTRDGLRESIPPAFTQHIGAQLLEVLDAAA